MRKFLHLTITLLIAVALLRAQTGCDMSNVCPPAAVVLPSDVQGAAMGVACNINSGTGLTCNLPNNVTVGNAIVIGTIITNNTGPVTISSVIHGGVDTCIATANSPYASTYTTSTMDIHICFGVTSTSKSTIVTVSSGTGYGNITSFVKEFSGVSAVDKTPAGNTVTGAVIASTLSGTTGFANEALYGITNSSGVPTATGTYVIPTNCPPSSTACKAANFQNETQWEQIVSSTGSYQIQSSNSMNWGALAVTLH